MGLPLYFGMNQSGFFVTPVLNPRTINSKFLDWEPNAFLLSLIFGKNPCINPFLCNYNCSIFTACPLINASENERQIRMNKILGAQLLQTTGMSCIRNKFYTILNFVCMIILLYYICQTIRR
jgi:hypothetical protein